MLPKDLQAKDHAPETEHTKQGMHKLSPIGRRYFRLIEFDDQENLALEIRKHFFGFFIILITGAFVILATLAVSIGITVGVKSDSITGNNSSGYAAIVLFIGLLLIVLEVISMLIGLYLYRSNVVFVTDQKIAQVLYLTIFNRKISQLNIGDVQDVTVTQKGLFAHVFDYGTMVIETAGEQQNYTFTYVPEPYQAAKTIIGLHEKNIAKFGN